MTNQASEDRLLIAIETLVDVSLDLGKQSKMMTLASVHTPQAIPDNEKLNMALQPYKDKVLHIVRTEKLKLLAELEEHSEVMNSDVVPIYGVPMSVIYTLINKLEAEL